MSIVVKRSPISATAEHLLHFARVVDYAKCVVVTRVCVSVCLCVCVSVCLPVRGRMPTL